MDKEQAGLFVIAVVPALLSVAAGVLIRAFRPEARARTERTGRMRQAAESLGLRFYGAEERMLAALPECSLFEKGTSRQVRNLMADGQRPPRLMVFDFECSRDRATPHHESVDALFLAALVRPPGGERLPYASIYRTDWFGGPIGVRDTYHLSAEDDPEFSTGYLLSGRPAGEVRALLTAPVRDAIKQWPVRGPRPVVEMLPGWLAVYVESEAGDRRIAAKCAAIMRYADLVAGALGGPLQARKR